MSLLSDEKIRDCWSDVEPMTGHSLKVHAFARAIESALLAKLAGAELPEPDKLKMLVIGLNHSYENVGERSFTEEGFYTAACEIFKLGQSQAYTQGAASQLSAEPSAFTDVDFMSIFVSEDIAKDCGATIELYTRKEPK